MSRNFDVLRKIEQEQGAMVAESPRDLSTSLDLEHTYTSGCQAGSPAYLEILKLVRVLFLSSAKAPHHVLFCGVGAGNGSGSVCLSAAKALAGEVSTRVCLVDAKGTAPSLERLLDPDKSRVTSPRSVEQRGFITRQIDRNLWFVSVGQLGAGNANCGAEQMCSGLLDLRKEYGYLLVDAPPIGANILASVLGQVTDGAVLVLEANATRRVAAQSAAQTLEAANVRLLGTVLNNRTFPIPEKLYRRL